VSTTSGPQGCARSVQKSVVGDLLDLMAVHRAIEGCERLCFAMSVASTYLEAAVNVAVVAKHHGVKAFVNLSQMTVNEMDIFNTTPSPQQKQHWLAEQTQTNPRLESLSTS
jgi:hypothetical protein